MSPAAALSPDLLRILAGMLCALGASSCYSLAPALQKEGLSTIPPLGEQPLGRQLSLLFKCRRWLLGFALGLLGFLPFTVALRLAGVAAVQPVMGLGLVVLVLYGYRRLGERLGPSGLVGVGLLLALPALIAGAGVLPPRASLETPSTRLILALGLAAVLVLSLPLGMASRRRPLLLAVPVGLLYCLLVICLQGAIGLLGSSGLGEGPAWRVPERLLRDARLWGAAGLLLLGLGTNVSGYYLAQLGLQRNAATRFNPLMNATTTLAGTSLGLLVYGQPVRRPLVYLLAMGFAVAGIVLLSGRQGGQRPEPAEGAGRTGSGGLDLPGASG